MEEGEGDGWRQGNAARPGLSVSETSNDTVRIYWKRERETDRDTQRETETQTHTKGQPQAETKTDRDRWSHIIMYL